jgi:hypothetical protein
MNDTNSIKLELVSVFAVLALIVSGVCVNFFPQALGRSTGGSDAVSLYQALKLAHSQVRVHGQGDRHFSLEVSFDRSQGLLQVLNGGEALHSVAMNDPQYLDFDAFRYYASGSTDLGQDLVLVVSNGSEGELKKIRVNHLTGFAHFIN